MNIQSVSHAPDLGAQLNGLSKIGSSASSPVNPVQSVSSNSTEKTGGIIGSILSALQSLTGSSKASTPTALTQDQKSALGVFTHDLFQALHAQDGVTTASPNNPVSGTNLPPIQQVQAHHSSGHHHSKGDISEDLQSLITQLSNSSSTKSSSSSQTNSSIAALQTGFNNLEKAFGISGNNATLSNFLSTFSNNLTGQNNGSAQGNFVNVHA